jgi:4-hydroxyphenylpyruvate dioxygenase-like putative hemolysin
MEQNDSKPSSSKTGLIVAAVVVLLGVGAGVYALTMQNDDDTTETSSSSSSQGTATNDTTNKTTSGEDAVSNVGSTIISFTDDGFDKSEYTSKAGEAVTVKNDSSMEVQFSSDDHPTHTEHSELNLDVLSPGESATFTPPGAGSYDFHDHINDQFTGTLIVE